MTSDTGKTPQKPTSGKTDENVSALTQRQAERDRQYAWLRAHGWRMQPSVSAWCWYERKFPGCFHTLKDALELTRYPTRVTGGVKPASM